MSKYNDLMNKVEVSADMKSRILLNLEKELEAEQENAAEAEKENTAEAERGNTAEAEKIAEADKMAEAETLAERTIVAEEISSAKEAQNDEQIQKAAGSDKGAVKEQDTSVVSYGDRAGIKRKASIKRFVALAATFAVLFIGVAAVRSATGGRRMASTSPSSGSMMMESASEAPAMDEAAEAPVEMEVASEGPVKTEEAAEAPVEMEAASEAPVEMETASEGPMEAEETEETAMDSYSEAPLMTEGTSDEANTKQSGSNAAGLEADSALEKEGENGGTSNLMSAGKEAESAQTNDAGSAVEESADFAKNVVSPAPATSSELLAAPADDEGTVLTGAKSENASSINAVRLIVAIVVLGGIVLSLIYLAWKSLKK